MVMVRLPSLFACDCMYSMSSTPLIDSSSGAATVSAMTLGLAPGYCARTTTVGGTTSGRSEEHTSELQSLMRISYAVFCLNKKTKHKYKKTTTTNDHAQT